MTYMGRNALQAFQLTQALRAEGIRADMDHCGRSLKAQFKYANKTGVRWTGVIGDEEAAAGTVKIRNMENGEEMTVAMGDVGKTVRGQ